MEFLFNRTTVICGSQNTSKSYTIKSLLDRLDASEDTYDIWILDPDDDLFLTYPMEYHVREAAEIDLNSDRMAVIVMDNPYNIMSPELLEHFTNAIALRKRTFIKLLVVQEPQMLNDAILSKVDNMIFSDGHIQRVYTSDPNNQRYIARHHMIIPLHIFKTLLKTGADNQPHRRDTSRNIDQPRTIHMINAMPPPPRITSRANSFNSQTSST